MNPILEQICRIGIIPVIAIDDAKKAVPLARSLVEGGLPAAEVTFRTCAAEEAMRAIAAEVPEMLLGAGTVLNHEQVDRALAAGAKFIVSPGFNPDTVRYVKAKGGLILPGTATPGEMEQAMAFGLEAVKFFPAEQNGGVAKLKAIAGPYKALKWMPTGGVSAKNLMDYLSFDQVVACGGTWMVKKDLIEAENWAEITRLTREAVDTMLGFSLAHVGINCLDAQASERTARTICGLFGLPFLAIGGLFMVMGIITAVSKNGMAQRVGYDVETGVEEETIVGLMDEVLEKHEESPSSAPQSHDHIPSTALNAKERLEQLQSLKDGGLITQAEYDQKRQEILRGL